jgi:hypothetical protein
MSVSCKTVMCRRAGGCGLAFGSLGALNGVITASTPDDLLALA